MGDPNLDNRIIVPAKSALGVLLADEHGTAHGRQTSADERTS
jgi:hypothetical protein